MPSMTEIDRTAEAASAAPRLRKDGKAARRPKLGLPPNHIRVNVPAKRRTGLIQNWHELIQPGPGVSEKRRTERRDAAAARQHEFLLMNPLQPNRRMRRDTQGRGYNPGRLVLHRTATKARSGGGIDRVADRVRRRAEREATR